MHWIVREARGSDVRALAYVGSATFLETFAGVLDGRAVLDHCERAHSASAYTKLLDAGGRAWLGEVQPGTAPIGFALLTSPDLPGVSEDGSDLELKRIYLLSKFHGRGVGAALMQAAVAAAREKGAGRLLLGVYAGNEHAQSFYRKRGFVQVASRRFRVGSKEYDDNVFALRLF